MKRKYQMHGRQYERTLTLYLALSEAGVLEPEAEQLFARMFVEQTIPGEIVLTVNGEREYEIISRLNDAALKLSLFSCLSEDDNKAVFEIEPGN